MKKILAMSLIAFTAVSTANAAVTSKAYVDNKFAEKSYVGTIPQESEATSVIGYVDEKAAAAQSAATYDDTALTARVSANETAIGDANSGLTKGVADNAAAISAINNATTGILATAEGYTNTKIGDLGDNADVMAAISAAQTAATYDDTALAARVSANEGDIAAINNATTGILATAEGYTDTKVGTMPTNPTTSEPYANVGAALSAIQTTSGNAVVANSAITASSANSIVQYDAKGLVLSGTAAGSLATKSSVGSNDIDANAVTLAKLSATLPSACQGEGVECVLKSSNSALAWEVITRDGTSGE